MMEIEPNIIKKLNQYDPNSYRTITLSNSLKILLISNPHLHKNSCAVNVRAGSLYDPPQMFGLAHLLQHMLFMGSKRFPKPNQFTEFLSMHSGYENAETNDEYTNYFFQISSQAFERAIIMMCDLLINPIFNDECIQQEKEAISEEFILAQNDNDNRRDEIIKQKYGIKPYSTFNMGNKESLKHPQACQYLKRYHQTYYSADVINVVLQTNLSIEEMQQKFPKYFEQIPNRKIKQHLNLPTKFLPCFKETRLLKIQSTKDQEYLIIVWSIEQLGAEERYQLFYYLRYIFCKSSNCLFNFLDELEYAQSCQLEHQNHLTYSLFTLKLCLTEQGVDHLNYVYGAILKYFNDKLVHSDHVYQEMCQIELITQKHKQIEDVEDYLTEISVNMIFMAQQDILSTANYLTTVIDPQHFDYILKKQIMDSCKKVMVYESGENIKNYEIQPFYSTKYYEDRMISPQLPKKIPQIEQFRSSPFLPLASQYKPSQNTNKNTPLVLHPNIYFYNPNREDKRSLMGSIKLFLHYDENFSYWHLFENFMNEITSDMEHANYAQVLGVEFSFNYIYGTAYLQMNGIAHICVHLINKIGQKIKEVLDDIANKQTEDLGQTFKDCKQDLIDDIDDFYDEEMDELTDKIRDQILLRNSLSLQDMEKEIEKIKKNKFLQRFVDIWINSQLQWVAVGNFSSDEIQNCCQNFQNNIGLKRTDRSVKLRQTQILKVPKQTLKHQIRLKDANIPFSTCMIYYEVGPFTDRLLFISQMLANYLDEPYYSTLRTLKKLSYDLQLNVVNTKGILGLCFLLVSSKHDPHKISTEIHNFLRQWSHPQKMSQQLERKMKKLKSSVQTKYLEQFSTNEDISDFIAMEIINRTYCFHQKNYHYLNHIIQSIDAQQLTSEAQRIFQHGCIEILILAKKHKNIYQQHRPKITTINDIKKKCQFYQDKTCDFQIGAIEREGQ